MSPSLQFFSQFDQVNQYYTGTVFGDILNCSLCVTGRPLVQGKNTDHKLSDFHSDPGSFLAL